ncbi:unnamed protein product [Rangifer tarandus platyrhynchus]|uniref:Uncharacterized protein n=1 Tax=Rangifer tarandus platyrhynchus TaxID=3082113 RepID=A0ABN8YN66_RANTA|nr:unnamed protein product [Rangifer tarandus platyrhynchus]
MRVAPRVRSFRWDEIPAWRDTPSRRGFLQLGGRGRAAQRGPESPGTAAACAFRRGPAGDAMLPGAWPASLPPPARPCPARPRQTLASSMFSPGLPLLRLPGPRTAAPHTPAGGGRRAPSPPPAPPRPRRGGPDPTAGGHWLSSEAESRPRGRAGGVGAAGGGGGRLGAPPPPALAAAVVRPGGYRKWPRSALPC